MLIRTHNGEEMLRPSTHVVTLRWIHEVKLLLLRHLPRARDGHPRHAHHPHHHGRRSLVQHGGRLVEVPHAPRCDIRLTNIYGGLG